MTRYVNIDTGRISNIHYNNPRWFRVVEGAEPEVGSVWVWGHGRGQNRLRQIMGPAGSGWMLGFLPELDSVRERRTMEDYVCIATAADAEAVLARIRGEARHEPAPAAKVKREPTHYVDPYIGARWDRAVKNLNCESDDDQADPVQPYAGQAERIRAILGDAVPPEPLLGWDPWEVDGE